MKQTLHPLKTLAKGLALGAMLLCSVLSVAQTPEVVSVGTGTLGNNNVPFGNSKAKAWTQTIYDKSYFDFPAGGTITDIAFSCRAIQASFTAPQITIYMGTTSQALPTDKYDWVPMADLQQVYSGYEAQPLATGWHTIHLTTPFDYNGMDHLVVCVLRNGTDAASSQTYHCANMVGKTGVFMMLNDATGHPGTAGANTRNTMLPNARFTVVPAAGCYPPVDLQLASTVRTSATLTWAAPAESTPQSYFIEYGPMGFERGTGTTLVAGTTSATLRGLTPSTRYDAYVHSVCAPGDTSRAGTFIRFTSACSPYALPYDDPFAGMTGASSFNPAAELPLCWEFPGLSTTASGYPRAYITTAHTLRLATKGGSAPAIAVLPAMENDMENCRLSFRVSVPTASSVTYGYVIDPTDPSTFVRLGDITITSTYDIDLEEDFETIPHGSRLAFRLATEAASEKSLTLYNVHIEPSPACKKPGAIAVDTSMLTHNAIRITWGGVQNQGETYRVRYAISGTTDSVTIENIHAQNLLLTGLQGGTQYGVAVDKLCGGTYTDATTRNVTTKGITNVSSENEAFGYVVGERYGSVGSLATFRVVAMPHYHFLRWDDGNRENPRTVPFTRESTTPALVALFAPDTHTVALTVNDDTRGSVNTTGGRYAYGSQIELVATPTAGNTFAGWSDGTLTPSYTYTVERDVTLTAHFCDATQVRIVGVLNDPSLGSITTVPADGIVNPGETVTVVVSLNDTAHYTFQWAPAPASTSATGMMRTAQVVAGSESQVISGVITPKMFTISDSVTSPLLGSVRGSGTYEYGSQVTLHAQPMSNVRFTLWRGDAYSTANPLTLVVDGNKKVIANFERDSITMQVVSSYAERGQVALRTPTGPTSMRMAVGDTIGLVASASTHYSFHSWSNGNTAPTQIVTAWGSNDYVRTYTAYFQPDMMEISAVANNRTWGSVDGSAVYGYGSNALLEATPYDHYFFIRWDDGSTDNPYRPLVTSNKTYTAIFGADALTITAGVDNPLHGSATVSGEIYYSGTVTLTADTLDGWSFKAWLNASGDTVSRSRIYTYQAFEDASYTAVFYRTRYHVLVTATAGMGEIVGGDVEGDYQFGDIITASTQVLDPVRYEFIGWSHTGSTDPNLVYSVDSSLTITAVYRERDQYTLSISSSNTAWGSVSTARTSYYPGEVAIIRATPAPHYRFVKWDDGSADSALNLRLLTMDRNYTLTAIFAPERYGVTVAVNDRAKGYVLGAGMYEYNSDAVLTAVPFEGQYFEGWNGQPSTMPTLTVHVTGDTLVTASFATTMIDIEVSGIFASTVGTGTYPYGTAVTISATPNRHYEFSHWSDGSTFNPRTLIVDNTENYIAHCTPRRYTISGTPNEPTLGYVTGSDTRPYGSQPSRLEAFANPNGRFVRWNDGVTNASRVITWDTNVSYVAYFVKDSFDVALVDPDPAYGTVNSQINGRYEYDTRLRLVATPHAGVQFRAWSDGDVNNPRIVVLRSDISGLTALFDSIDYHIDTITTPPAMGHIVLSPAKEAYRYGDQVTVSYVNHDENLYRFVAWEDGTDAASRTITITSDVTLRAIFALADLYSVAVVSNNEQWGTALGSVAGVPNASAHTIVARPAEHCHFLGWSDGSTDTLRTIVIDHGDFVAQALFAQDSHSVALTATVGGTVAGDGLYPYGSRVVITASPQAHFRFAGWSDGVADNPRTLLLEADTSFEALFAVTQVYVAATAISGTVQGTGHYDYGTTVQLSVLPDEGYTFVGWTDGVTDNPRTLDALTDTHLVALCQQLRYQVSLVAANAEVTGSGTYAYGDTVTVCATPNDHYHFVGWAHDEAGNHMVSDQPCYRFVVQGDVMLYAVSALDMLTISAVAAPEEGGFVLGTGSYSYGSTVRLIAQAEEGYRFTGWTLPWSSHVYTPVVTFTATESFTAVANFASLVGIDEADEPLFGIVAVEGAIRIYNAAGESMRIFDAVGRQVVSLQVASDEFEVVMPASGIYLVQVGEAAAKRLSVIR